MAADREVFVAGVRAYGRQVRAAGRDPGCGARGAVVRVVGLAVGLFAAAGLHASEYGVSSAADSGAGSLRAAIDAVNADASLGPHQIRFAIPGAGPHTIALSSELPAIARAAIIDGYSQPGASPNTLVDGSNAAIRIRLRPGPGTALRQGLHLVAPGCEVRGLAVAGFRAGTGIRSQPLVTIQGNQIGFFAEGGLGGNIIGVLLEGDGQAGGLIGGTTPAARNVISGNTEGVSLWQLDGVSVLGNQIGTAANGEQALPNGSGIAVRYSQDLQIGNGSAAGRNHIAYNGDRAVLVGIGSSRVAIRNNRIHANRELGIDLSNSIFSDGVSANDDAPDADAGGNGLQNFPTLFAADVEAGGASFSASGELRSEPSRNYLLEFYGNDAPDGSGHGEGQQFLSSLQVSTDLEGRAGFSLTGLPLAGRFLSATATRLDVGGAGDTSEFSDLVPITGLRLVVTSSASNGPGSFVAALGQANAYAGPGIPLISWAAGIAPTTVIEDVDVQRAMAIDSRPAPAPPGAKGAAAARQTIVLGPLQRLTVNGDDSLLRGLRIEGAQFTAMLVYGHRNVFNDLEFAANGSGMQIFGNDNAVSASRFQGHTAFAGIGLLEGAARTLISGNRFDGNTAIALRLSGVVDTLVSGNRFEDNTGKAITVQNAGVDALRNRVTRNRCSGNGGLCIDLGNNGVSANDVGDADSGPNLLQNHPVLSAAEARLAPVAQTVVDGELDATASRHYRLEFFSASQCHASGRGEAELFLGAVDVVTEANGLAAFTATLPVAAPGGSVVVASATDADGNTSELSGCVGVLQRQVFRDGFEGVAGR